MRATPGQIVHIPPLKRSPKKTVHLFHLIFCINRLENFVWWYPSLWLINFGRNLATLYFYFDYIWLACLIHIVSVELTQLRLTEDYIGVRGHIFQLLYHSQYNFTVRLHWQSSKYILLMLMIITLSVLFVTSLIYYLYIG